MTEAAASQNPQTSPSFEQALQRLEQIVQQLEDGRTDLGASLAGYEEGVNLLRQCHGLLQRAERRIELLSGVDADGKPTTQPFDDEATISLEEKAQTRSKRRSTKKSTPSDVADAGNSATAGPDSVDEPNTLF